MTRVVVTGASGFIGTNLVEYLRREGFEPIAWVRRQEAAEVWRQRGVEAFVGDLDSGAKEYRGRTDVSAIFHLAALVAPYDRSKTFAVNVEGARRFADGVSEWKTPPVFIYASSLAASGSCEGNVPRREGDVCKPRSIYGTSKLAAEEALRGLAGRLAVTVVRPPAVIGPHDRNLLQLCQMVQRGWNVVGVSSAFRYSFIHSEDLCRAMHGAFERGRRLSQEPDRVSDGVYFVADGESITMVDLANAVAKGMGLSSPRHLVAPKWVCWPMAGISDFAGRYLGMRVFLNLDKMREAVAGSWVCDVSKAREELGFAVTTPLIERIAQTVAWYREQGWIATKRS